MHDGHRDSMKESAKGRFFENHKIVSSCRPPPVLVVKTIKYFFIVPFPNLRKKHSYTNKEMRTNSKVTIFVFLVILLMFVFAAYSVWRDL